MVVCLTSEEIRATVNQIRASRKKEPELRTIYFDFLEAYPKLFAAAIDPTFPMTFLERMLIQLDALNKKEIDIDAADKEVYGELQKVYIDPVIPTIPSQDSPST